MVTISVNFNKSNDKAIRQMLFASADKVKKATGIAIARSTKSMRAQASKIIREDVNLSKRIVDNRIKRFFTSETSGGISIKDKPQISLKLFKPKQTKLGVTYKPRKSGGKVLIPSAFGPMIRKLGRNVYVRNTKSRKPLTLKKFFNLAQQAASIGAVLKIRKEAAAIFAKQMSYQMQRLFQKKGT